jgi:hypothetical protein
MFRPTLVLGVRAISVGGADQPGGRRPGAVQDRAEVVHAQLAAGAPLLERAHTGLEAATRQGPKLAEFRCTPSRRCGNSAGAYGVGAAAVHPALALVRSRSACAAPRGIGRCAPLAERPFQHDVQAPAQLEVRHGAQRPLRRGAGLPPHLGHGQRSSLVIGAVEYQEPAAVVPRRVLLPGTGNPAQFRLRR